GCAALCWLSDEARRRSMAQWPCDCEATQSESQQSTAQRVADLWRCRSVARRSKIHGGYSLSSRLAPAPNLKQRTRSRFMSWLLIPEKCNAIELCFVSSSNTTMGALLSPYF